jgi:hypothetical protein
MVNTVKLQVDYQKIIHGDGDVPFLIEAEEREPEDQGGAAAITLPRATLIDPLMSGPSQNHPWPGQRVHRRQR